MKSNNKLSNRIIVIKLTKIWERLSVNSVHGDSSICVLNRYCFEMRIFQFFKTKSLS